MNIRDNPINFLPEDVRNLSIGVFKSPLYIVFFRCTDGHTDRYGYFCGV